MKKSKKKHIKFILTIIGLTVFLLVVMLIFYLYYPTKPDFKITKEECHNETLSSKGNYGDLTMMDYDVCNQVEVDKIRTDCRINCNDEGFKDTTNCEMKDGCELLYQPVLKKGLSISWLDENAECILKGKLGDLTYEWKCNEYQEGCIVKLEGAEKGGFS